MERTGFQWKGVPYLGHFTCPLDNPRILLYLTLPDPILLLLEMSMSRCLDVLLSYVHSSTLR